LVQPRDIGEAEAEGEYARFLYKETDGSFSLFEAKALARKAALTRDLNRPNVLQDGPALLSVLRRLVTAL
jgi:hypothetical protein